MATRLSLCQAPAMSPCHAPTRGPTNSRFVMMCANNYHISVNLQIRPSQKNKVFEDRLAGIVCYRDENGEVTCEGYDEGPRFQQQLSRFIYSPSADGGIIEILERCWLQVADEKGLNNADKGQADFNSNR